MFEKRGAVFSITANNQIKQASDWTDVVNKKSTAEGIIIHKNLNPNNSQNIVCKIDLDNHIYIHTTIMASVDLEPNSDYWITKATEKYINNNGDSWTRDALLKDYKTFVDSGCVYVEHDQNPEKAKGRVLDAVARDMGDTILIDLLFCVDKRHSDLVHNIETGLANAVSMGCTTKYTICSICGNVAHDENEYCLHVKNMKNQMVKCADGKYRKVCELCFENTFYDCSIVANPAFAGAVFRRLVAADKLSSQLLANILCRKLNSQDYQNELLKVASNQRFAEHPILHNEQGDYKIEDPNGDIPYHDPYNIKDVFEEQQEEVIPSKKKDSKKKIAKCEDYGSLVILNSQYDIPEQDRTAKHLFNFIAKDTVGRLVGREDNTCAVYFNRIGMIRNIPLDKIAPYSAEDQFKFNKYAKKLDDKEFAINRKGIFTDSEDRFQVLSVCNECVEVRWLDGEKMGKKEKLPRKTFTDKNVNWAVTRDLVKYAANWNGKNYQVNEAEWNEKFASILDQYETHIDNVQHDITCLVPLQKGMYNKSFNVTTKFANTTFHFNTKINDDNLNIDVKSTTW